MNVYLVGIKGTGMASLAALLQAMGHQVAGCDTSERFATDRILEEQHIRPDVGFSATLLGPHVELVIHSSAYDASTPILQAAQQRGIQTISYPAYIASLSSRQKSWAVAGTHGKTTTVSVATHLLASLLEETPPFYALYGSQFSDRYSVPYWGDEVALFEACEYQDHFLSYRLSGLLITSIGWEHVDYFANLEAVMASFQNLVTNLLPGAALIYNSDDANVAALVDWARPRRPDLRPVAYGLAAHGPYRLSKDATGGHVLDTDEQVPLPLTVSDPNLVADHVGALVLASSMLGEYRQEKPTDLLPTLAGHLGSFGGAVGRLEVMETVRAITFIDDYAHHPAEITVTLNEVRQRYPGQPILVIFSPHTASRTLALMDEFVDSLKDVEHLIIQSTFASARFDMTEEDPVIELLQRLATVRTKLARFAITDEQVIDEAVLWLQEPAVCITMGAGNNRALTALIVERMRSRE